VSRLNPETGDKQLILTIADAFEYGEAGLLGMALHPDFTSSPWVYLVNNYSEGSNIRERLLRYNRNGNVLNDPVTPINGIPGNSYQNGSRLVFGPDGKLYMSTGDAGNIGNSRNLNSLAGKMLRINPDGSITIDNPFVNSYILVFGLRNTQGLVFTPEGRLYGSEHGPVSDDEINLLEACRNYGWPAVAGFCHLPDELGFCQTNNVKEPLYAWTPMLAIAGTGFYYHSSIPEWQGPLLRTTLKASRLVSLKLSSDGLSVSEVAEWFPALWGRPRDVCISPDGRVFIGVSNRDGRGTPMPGDDRIVEIKAKNTTGWLARDTQKQNIQIFPNPVRGEARVEWAGKAGTAEYFIMDTSGIIHGCGVVPTPVFPISAQNLIPGYYLLKISDNSQSTTVPFLVM